MDKSMLEINEEQVEEIEALQSIFEDDFCSISSCPPCFMIKLTDLDINLSGSLHLKVTFTPCYPNEVPVIEFPMRQAIVSPSVLVKLVEYIEQVALENVGMAMTFTLVEEAKNWLNQNVTDEPEQDVEDDEVEDEEDDVSLSMKECKISEPKMSGGRWDFVIGLVGKPSAGKSTFFNAATSLELAKTGAHPFTTIEPNFGKAFYSIPCPCSTMCKKQCDAAHGHNFEGRRHVPVLLKDVAGLIPGASDGKGLGNRFLNDLLDADVFIHIVDVSGCTNEKGEQAEGHDPSLDVPWLQNEIHKWIFDNVMAKWDAIKRKPSKLIDMFTGYHATKSVIHTALVNAGVDPRDLSGLQTWQESVIHRIVSEFLLLRFPMLLVLNKCDIGDADENIKRLQDKFPLLPSIPVSAMSEMYLQKLQKSGAIEYENGRNEIKIVEHESNPSSYNDQKAVEDIKTNVIQRHGSTNVHRALCRAVSLRAPSYIFPVQCLETFKSYNKHSRDIRILGDCISLKPQTTVEEAFVALRHYPTSILSGDFVRAETIDAAGNRRQVRKDEAINEDNKLLRIMTTKRVH